MPLFANRPGMPFAMFWQRKRKGTLREKHHNSERGNRMTLIIYLVGWLILIGGVSWALVAMHVSQHTIAIVAVIMLGIAIITGATRARNRDRS
jgi:uncharacterized membrane protein